jgi:hypothetical protein
LGNLFKDLNKGRDLNFTTLFGSLDPQQRWLPITIQKGFDHEILLLIDEALAEFL